MMFMTYCSSLQIHSLWYGFPLGTCVSDDLSVAPNYVEKLDARDTIRMYNDTVNEDFMDFGDTSVNASVST